MTKTQRKYVDYILLFKKRHGFQPTLQQMSERFDRSVSSIHTTLAKTGLKYASYRKISKTLENKLVKESKLVNSKFENTKVKS